MWGWLLWAAVGTTATLNAYSFPPLLSTTIGSLLCLAWICLNVSTAALIKSFLCGTTDIFFRQIVSVGAHKLNLSREPILLAIAPHSNQFIDPLIVMRTFERPIGFLCAAKSMRYKKGMQDAVAFFARTLGAVPVERAQDLAKAGSGKLMKVDGTKAHGSEETRFSREIKVGDSLVVANVVSGRVVEVVSDSIVVLSEAFDIPSSPDGVKYKVQPKLNQSEMYNAVYERLVNDGVVGIFPEGGSHDRASLLPLKAGIAVMALGACDKYGEALRSKLKIVPVGLNYFSGHRFRSRVFVDYGRAFSVDADLVERYKNKETKRAAADELMAKILTEIQNVTVQAPDHSTQELFYMLRRLYVADSQRELSLEQKVAISRGFASCFNKGDADLPEVKALLSRVSAYNEKLKQFQIHDRRVSLGESIDPVDALAILCFRLGALAFYAVALVPGICLASPLLVLSEVISRAKARAAVKGSRVKLEGKDVVGTWKVLVGMIVVPILHFGYTLAIYSATAYRHAIAYFFFMPFISATSILASERAIATARSLGPLWMLLVNNDQNQELRKQRRALQSDVRHLAHDLGWDEIITKSTSLAELSFYNDDQPSHHHASTNTTDSLHRQQQWAEESSDDPPRHQQHNSKGD